MKEFQRMTESADAKPKLTRRGMILGAAGLALIVAVVLVGLGVFGPNSAGSVNATFMGFEQSADKSTFLAVLHLTNETTMELLLFETDETGAVPGRFHSQPDNGECWLGMKIGHNAFESLNFEPHSARVVKVPLPNNGSKGRVEVWLGTMELFPTSPLGRLRLRLRSNIPFREKKLQAVCDQDMQCPLVLPDGTVQPPRLMSARERKQ